LKFFNSILAKHKNAGLPLGELEVDLEDVVVVCKEIYQWRCLITN